jgi:hypothetical protein
MTNREMQPLKESGVEPSCKTKSLSGSREHSACSKAHHVRDPHQLAPTVAFFHLAIDQARRYLPLKRFPPSTSYFLPLAKMGCEGREVQIEAITGEERQTERRPGFVVGSG